MVVRTARLELQPLTVAHADAMYRVLADPALYRHLDYQPPPNVEHTRAVYARLEAGASPDGTQRWLNWIVVPHGGAPIGFVQATVPADGSAWIAYLLATAAQGRGYATEGVAAMTAHLASHYRVDRLLAMVEADNARSIALLGRIGLHAATAAELAGRTLSATERLYVGAPSH